MPPHPPPPRTPMPAQALWEHRGDPPYWRRAARGVWGGARAPRETGGASQDRRRWLSGLRQRIRWLGTISAAISSLDFC